MQKIIPHLWFDKEAAEAAKFYESIFPDSKVTNIRKITDTPSGDCDVVSFDIMGTSFQAISAGPYFKINPSISFMLNFDPSQDPHARARIDEIWDKLSEGGEALMPLDRYPFSERYGWIKDKFGVTWQLIFSDPQGESRPRLMPAFMFANELNGKAEEASDFYISVFKDSKRGALARYPDGKAMFTDFMLEKQWHIAMDAPGTHEFGFNEAVSLIVKCADQAEIDYYWDKLSAVPESEQCGWLKDKYGVSWQITPARMDEMMSEGTPEQIARVTQAFLKMKKFDIAALEEAYKENK